MRTAVVLLLVAVSTAFASCGRADEPGGVQLMRPDSLAGWDHAPQTPSGWTLAEGRLTGTKDATPLLSGFTAGDCRLSLDWSVANGGVLKIALPEVPNGKGLELLLREGDGCGELRDGEKQLAPGTTIGPIEGGIHTAALRREGRQLVVSVDGKELYDVPIEPSRRFGLALAVIEGKATVSQLRGAEPVGRPLFDGDSLDGWSVLGLSGNSAPSGWRIKGGELVLTPSGECSFLTSQQQFGNFVLSFEYRTPTSGNSGVGLRIPPRGWPSRDGMEIQILEKSVDGPLDALAQMSIYGAARAFARADRPKDWNHVVVKADGWMVSAWINGEFVQQYNTLDHPELKHRHLRGCLGFQDHHAEIHIRNIRILEAPDGTGLDVWSAPKPPTAETAMIDRLMNSESLARDDGIRSGVVASHCDTSDGPCVLADLTGPGAVVRIAHRHGGGVLAMYFDGETTPRIECPVNELWQHVPPFGVDVEPVLSMLGYEKSLRIVLRKAGQTDYRIDYVTFPKNLPVATFNGRDTSLPRGWGAAPLYRQQVFKWGIHREKDPMPRFQPEPKTITPGETVDLAHCDGAGIVRWVKLRGDAKLLANNDLWLEVTIDGEDSPAISAPARFWLPGLIGGAKYRNFVLVSRDGLANFLAMPFGNGVTIRARNQGAEPIAQVGVELSVEPATDANRDAVVARPRLRGVFQAAGSDSDELLHQKGKGRWVGLVVAAPQGVTPGIASLVADGKPLDGWATANLDLFLGCGGHDFRSGLAGKHWNMAWRWLVLAPVDFQESLVLKATAKPLPERLALFYVYP